MPIPSLASKVYWGRGEYWSPTLLPIQTRILKSYDQVSSHKASHGAASLVNKDGSPAFTVEAKGQETTITVQEATAKFLKTLVASAEDYLGHKIDAAVIAVGSELTEAQIKALESTAESIGIKILQLIPSPAAAAQAYGLTEIGAPDRTVVILDVGASSTTATVFAARSGILNTLATAHNGQLGGDSIDEHLIEYFKKEFKKKSKLDIESTNARALMKLRLASEVTKRSLSASTSAGCSVESLADGIDFSTTINRTRLELIAGSVFTQIEELTAQALKEAKLEPCEIDEVGSCCSILKVDDI